MISSKKHTTIVPKPTPQRGVPGMRLILSIGCVAATLTGWAFLAQQEVPAASTVSAVRQPPDWLKKPVVLPTPPVVPSNQAFDPALAAGGVTDLPVRWAPAPLREVQPPPPPIIITSSSR